MPHKEDAVRLQHMLDAARDAIRFAAGKSRQDLDTDKLLALSLVRTVEIIGEAASRTSKELRDQHDGIPWSDIVGMRNRLIHAYYDVNLTIVWRTVVEELPPLIDALESILTQTDTQ